MSKTTVKNSYPDYEIGSFDITVAAGAYGVVEVEFEKEYNSIPLVLAIPSTYNNEEFRGCVNTKNVTTTGTYFRVDNLGTAASDHLQIKYIVIPTDSLSH